MQKIVVHNLLFHVHFIVSLKMNLIKLRLLFYPKTDSTLIQLWKRSEESEILKLFLEVSGGDARVNDGFSEIL